MIFQIAYVSASRTPANSAGLSKILRNARRNNKRDGLTGLLKYHDQQFFQVLEGEKSEVETCFDRILRDPRHFGISLMWRGTVRVRAFPAWSMGYAGRKDLGQYADAAPVCLADPKCPAGRPIDTTSIAMRLARTVFSHARQQAS